MQVRQLRQGRRRGRSRARQRPGRRADRRLPELHGPRQRQPDHAPGRRRADHEHVPVAAGGGRVLPALRGRRLRHVGDRPRVHARDLQPHGRRARRGPDLQRRRPGAGDGRVLLRPDRGRVPDGARLRAVRRREPVRGRRLRHGLQAEGHPQLRDERLAAQLLRRAGLRRQRQRQPARRRRDLERGELRHPPGARRQARRRDGRRPARLRPRGTGRPTSARATGAGCRSSSTPTC